MMTSSYIERTLIFHFKKSGLDLSISVKIQSHYQRNLSVETDLNLKCDGIIDISYLYRPSVINYRKYIKNISQKSIPGMLANLAN